MKTIAADEQATQQLEDEFVNDDVEMSDAQEAQLDAYKNNATLLVFSEKSQAAVLQELQVDKNPVKSIALTANDLNRQLQSGLEADGEGMTEVTLCLGAAHLVGELILLAEAAGLYELTPEDRLEAFRHTVMKYFADGLADGSIDPAELQATIEPIMTEEQRAFGLQHAEQNGILKTKPPVGMARPPQQQAQPQSVLEGGGQNGF